ncbi:MAG: hypothetical protein L0216_21395 [Planctomycetales bacterium]|nr:hypothetical protein [Planctomycetales bacterium]
MLLGADPASSQERSDPARALLERGLDVVLRGAGIDPASTEAKLAKEYGIQTFNPYYSGGEYLELARHLADRAVSDEDRSMITRAGSSAADGDQAAALRHIETLAGRCGCHCCGKALHHFRRAVLDKDSALIVSAYDLETGKPLTGVRMTFAFSFRGGVNPPDLVHDETTTDETGTARIPLIPSGQDPQALRKCKPFSWSMALATHVGQAEDVLSAHSPGGLFGRRYVALRKAGSSDGFNLMDTVFSAFCVRLKNDPRFRGREAVDSNRPAAYQASLLEELVLVAKNPYRAIGNYWTHKVTPRSGNQRTTITVIATSGDNAELRNDCVPADGSSAQSLTFQLVVPGKDYFEGRTLTHETVTVAAGTFDCIKASPYKRGYPVEWYDRKPGLVVKSTDADGEFITELEVHQVRAIPSSPSIDATPFRPRSQPSCGRCSGTQKCSQCDASKWVYCPDCDGRYIKSKETCDICKGNPNRCIVCEGRGKRGGGARCDHCNGTGNRTCSQCKGTGQIDVVVVHQACGGTGRITCPTCAGSGVCPNCRR